MVIIIFIKKWVSWKAVSRMAKRRVCVDHPTKNYLHLSASDQCLFSMETVKNPLMPKDHHSTPHSWPNSNSMIKQNSLKCSSVTQYIK
jgi:hypothetical protein